MIKGSSLSIGALNEMLESLLKDIGRAAIAEARNEIKDAEDEAERIKAGKGPKKPQGPGDKDGDDAGGPVGPAGPGGPGGPGAPGGSCGSAGLGMPPDLGVLIRSPMPYAFTREAMKSYGPGTDGSRSGSCSITGQKS